MQKNKNNTDNNFSEIENNTEADLSQMDNHWAQMKNTLAKTTSKNATPKKWLWVSVPVIAAIGLVLFFATKNPNDNTAVIENNTIAAEIKNTLQNTEITQNNIDTTKKSKTTNTSQQTRVTRFLNTETEVASNTNSNTASSKKKTDDKIFSTTNKTFESKNTNEHIATDTVKVDMSLVEIQNIKILNEFIAKIQKRGELFTINNLRDTTIQAAEGTVFFIPKNSFYNEGSVVFEVKEYYKYSDMIANGLKTMADDKQLISGGMLSLTATVNGKEIAMNPTKEIRVFIPNLTPKDSMEIFEGRKKEMLGTKSISLIKQNNINWELTKVRIDSVVLKMFIRAIDLKDNTMDYTLNAFNNKTKVVFRRAINSSFSKTELLDMLRKKYGDYYDKIRVHNQWKRNLLFKKVEGQEEEYYKLAYNSYGVGDTAELLPSTIRTYKLTPIDTVYKPWKWIIKGTVTTNVPYFSPSTLKLIGEKYSIGIDKLGWINCDRFYNYPGKKSSIIVELKDSAHLYVNYMIFEKLKVIIQGYANGKTALFSNIPIGEPVKIISIGVKNKEVVTAVQSIITSTNTINDLIFTPTSTTDFMGSLKKLDKN
jgi:hypothetical protein